MQSKLALETKLFYGLLIAFSVIYLLTFPQGWLISDEYSYVNMAVAMIDGNTQLSYSDAVMGEIMPYSYTKYALGNSFWIALWALIFGVKNIYLGSLFAVVTGSILLYKVLCIEKYFLPAISLVFIYPSLIFFGYSTMSAVPSYLLVCLFIYSLFRFKDASNKWFWLSMLASFSFWFRETNIVLLGGVCLVHFLQDRRWFSYYVLGAMIGMMPRVISSYVFYDDALFYTLAESFSLRNIVGNLPIYALLSLVAMPGGIVFLAWYKGRYRWSIVVSCFLFLGMYLMYSFNASIYSGFSKGVILMGRFLIPLLPFFVLAVSYKFRNWKVSKRLTVIAFSITFGCIVFMMFKVSEEARIHDKISHHIYEKYGDDLVLYDHSRRTNIVRYINPIRGSLSSEADINRVLDFDLMSQYLSKNGKAIIIQSLNTENEAKLNLTDQINAIIQGAKSKYNTRELEMLKVKPGLDIQIILIEGNEQ